MRVLLFLGLMVPCICMGEDGFPLLESIPDSVWALQEEPEKNIYDAIIVMHKTKFEEERIHHYRLIRILSKSGQDAGKLFALPQALAALRGRVISRDGVETKLKLADVHEVLNYATADEKENTRVVLPPGLTDDCLVELAWSEKAEEALPLDVDQTSYAVQDHYYIKEKQFLFSLVAITKLENKVYGFATRFFWTKIAAPATFEQSVFDEFTVLKYKNVPAREYHPFGAHHESEAAAFVRVFKTLSFRGGSTYARFWDNFGEVYVQYYYSPFMNKTSEYKNWVRRIHADMPADKSRRLTHVLNAFKARFAYVHQMTADELRKVMVKEKTPIPRTSGFLGEAMQKGYLFKDEASLFVFTMMRDCGLKVELLFAPLPGADFNPEELNPFQLDISEPVIGMKGADGKWLVVASSKPEYLSGKIPPRFRGEVLVRVRPVDDFQVDFIRLPRMNHNGNQYIKQYQMVLRADGTCQMKLGQRGTGAYDAVLRRRLLRLEQEEQNELMETSFRQLLPDWKVSGTSVKNVRGTDKHTAAYTNAVRRLDIKDYEWFLIDPFPASSPISAIPSLWPEDRREPIRFGFSKVQKDSCKLTLPKGWSLRSNPSWTRENQIGKIQVKVSAEGSVVRIERKIIFTTDRFPASAEADLKVFMTWMENALGQTIAINRGES